MNSYPVKFAKLLRNRAIPCLFLLLLHGPARAERLPIRTYTVADGLAHNTVNKIVRDSRGFLWFCTADGLSRFDGYGFANYGANEGLPHPYVNDLLRLARENFGSPRMEAWRDSIPEARRQRT